MLRALLLSLSVLAGLVLASLWPNSLVAETSANRFSEYYDQIYQVRVFSPEAGSKSSIGSGFQVTADGLIATNYHVVSDFVQRPEKHQVEYRSHTGETGSLELLDFDVVNDLALLRIDQPADRFFSLSGDTRQEPSSAQSKGGLVYALGNPRDYGVTLVQGFNNGLVAHSYNDQLLFSGSLNPGMSGGPTLNANAEVVGVNVATAGSQLSFLIPADKLINLISVGRALEQSDYQDEIATQIKQWQRPRLQSLIDEPWPTETFADRELFGEIRKDFQCWGDTNSDNVNRSVAWTNRNCQTANQVFLSGRLNIGQLLFSFSEQESIKLNRFQFAQTLSPDMGADNQSNFENSTSFKCKTGFLDTQQKGQYRRINSCIRAHKKLHGLFDSLLLVEVNEGLTSFLAHLSITGAEPDQIKALNTKFTERVQ
ncbi:MAG: serine protease [Arenicella sp.]|jgi:serine protease Do|nr:serine protease [Arenicella sp.]